VALAPLPEITTARQNPAMPTRCTATTLTRCLAYAAAGLALLAPVDCGTAEPTDACPAAVTSGVLPEWARIGFTDPEPVMPHVLGARGEIVAVVFGDPLSSPPLPDRSNKILWVARVPGPGPFTITARCAPDEAPVVIRTPDGPGPSIVDLPAPGCWHLDLRWSGGSDELSLRYTVPR
jgi:hypothetical protein